MKRLNRTNLMLLAMVLLLCAGVLAELQRERWQLSQPLTALDLKHVHKLTIECSDCRARHFEMLQGHWWMREPYALPANPESIVRLLAIATAPVRKRRAATEFDPGKLGLEPPQASLMVGEVRIEFGNTDAINGDRYVRLHDDIAMVPDRFSAWLMAPPESELDHHLVPPGASLTQLRIDGQPQPALLANWQAAETSQVVAVKSRDTLADAQAHTVELTLSDNNMLRYSLRRHDGGYLAVRDDPVLGYPLEESQVQSLLPTTSAR